MDPLLTTLGLIAFAELGDKTQLTVIALSAGYDRVKVFAGAILAFVLVTGLGVLVGDALVGMVPPSIMKTAAGLLFVVFGAWILYSRESCDPESVSPLCNPLLSAFSMIVLAEMGDKTQLSAITLSAKYGSPYLVFLGAILALASISLVGIILGSKLCERVPLSKIRLGAGALFMIFGLLFLAGF